MEWLQSHQPNKSMHRFRNTKNSGLGYSTALSALLHGAVFGLVIWWQQFIPAPGPMQTTYYVDVVNLPVASPRLGDPAGSDKSEDAALLQTAPVPVPPAPAAPVVPVAPTKPAMTVPAKQPTATQKTIARETAAFEEQMAKMEGRADARRQSDAIEAIRKKVVAGRAGMPDGTGSEAGSDYTAYLHSRLKDAFKDTISYQSKNPFVMLRLTIDGDGRIIRTRIEKSSGDKVFELSVNRAIAQAEQTLVPPPDRKLYEGAFVFKPEGISQQ